MTDRGPVTRCRVKGCAFIGHFTAWDDLCPSHRNDPPARIPTLIEAWESDDAERR